MKSSGTVAALEPRTQAGQGPETFDFTPGELGKTMESQSTLHYRGRWNRGVAITSAFSCLFERGRASGQHMWPKSALRVDYIEVVGSRQQEDGRLRAAAVRKIRPTSWKSCWYLIVLCALD